LLAEVFVERASRRLERKPPRMSRSVSALLRGYPWPGNVRELEKVMTRAVLMASDDERIRDRHLPESILRGAAPTVVQASDDVGPRPLKEQIAELERQVVYSTLQLTGWNRSAAARKLRVSYPTLLQKIRIYNLKES